MNKWPKEVMLAKEYDPKRVKDWSNYAIEPKLDGVRCIILGTRRDGVTFHSRNGRQWHMFDALKKYVIDAHMLLRRVNSAYDQGIMLDGEIVCSSFANSAGTIHRKNYQADDAVFYCFHCMPIDYFYSGGDDREQAHRKQELLAANTRLVLAGPIKVVKHVPIEDHATAIDVNRRHVENGYEGSIVKDLSMPWLPKRSHAWMKIKEEISVDVQVTDMKEGDGKYKGTLGSLVVRYKKRNVNVSGMTDAQRDQFWRERFSKNTIIGKTVEVQCQLITEKGSLRHPRFKRIRDDK